MKEFICDNCWRREPEVDTTIMVQCKCGHPMREVLREVKIKKDSFEDKILNEANQNDTN